MGRESALRLTPLRRAPELVEPAAEWFAGKWSIPVSAYRESMESCLRSPGGVPQWYVVQNAGGGIAAGLGMIENDFHPRRDLTPNVCAVYVEPAWRRRGVARCMLDYVRWDAGRLGLETLYLLTDHTSFYERCGWNFWCMVPCDGGESRMYRAGVLPALPPGPEGLEIVPNPVIFQRALRKIGSCLLQFFLTLTAFSIMD